MDRNAQPCAGAVTSRGANDLQGLRSADDVHALVLGQPCRAGEQIDALLTPGLTQQARRAAPHGGRGDRIRIEHQPHSVANELAFFARRSARIVAISWATSSGDIMAGSSTPAMRFMAENSSSTC